MKPSSIDIIPEVGQYWLIPGSKTPSKIIRIDYEIVFFDDDSRSVLPLGKGFTYLWYTCELHMAYFGSNASPKPGQIWVDNHSQDIFFIHPDQSNCGGDMFRVLSDSSNVGGPLSLFVDVNPSDNSGQDTPAQQ